ncbi:unnamed protein product, partial [Ectocarpus sp. 8 AP-2014]
MWGALTTAMCVGFAERFLLAFAFSALRILRMLAPSSGTLILPSGTEVLSLITRLAPSMQIPKDTNTTKLGFFQVARRGKSRQERPKLKPFYFTAPPVFSPPRALSPSQRSLRPRLHHHRAALRPPSHPRFPPPPWPTLSPQCRHQRGGDA